MLLTNGYKNSQLYDNISRYSKRKMRKIVGFSSFRFHYEMFGYLIHYCKERNYSLTIYCDFHFDNGFMEFYHQLFQYPFLYFKQLWGAFEYEINHYDAIVLFTDNDYEFNIHESKILNRTLMIEHSILRRCEYIPHALSTRPYDYSLIENTRQYFPEYQKFTEPSTCIWALPTYPILFPNQKTPLAKLSRQTTICILGGCDRNINLNIIKRFKPLKNTDSKIKLFVISRKIEFSKFKDLDTDFEIEFHSNICTEKLVEILKKVDFMLTDFTNDIQHMTENGGMSGCIPMTFSFLIPLIISKQSNRIYQFKNVIEFDKLSHDPIQLELIDPQLIANEREQMVNKNMLIFDQIFQTIFITNGPIDSYW